MIFALGTPVNSRTHPWAYDWTIKPDALMISAIDFLNSPSTFKRLCKKGIHEILNWDGQIVCDSGAFSAINRKKKITFDMENLKEVYRELTDQDSNIIKITLDFPDEKILENYNSLSSLEVQPVIPHERLDLLDSIIRDNGNPEWIFIGRLVPLMRSGGGHANRLFPVLEKVKKHALNLGLKKKQKFWALGVGAPSLMLDMVEKVDGCDSARWRITGSNMVLLPNGGERGIGNRSKWRGTHHRIGEGLEKQIVIEIIKQIDANCGSLEKLDESFQPERSPSQIKDMPDEKLPLMGQLMPKLRKSDQKLSIYELELILRSSNKLRLFFNYWAALSFKTSLKSTVKNINPKQKTLEDILSMK